MGLEWACAKNAKQGNLSNPLVESVLRAAMRAARTLERQEWAGAQCLTFQAQQEIYLV